ncbi:hypothetical protein PR048_033629 [Dryococelus australis]|uniref:Uncharacterized protein n=1 Tax=Dryococelus australis TaxID=614101 RepID=A0ABQ9G0V1_9NEOP|nr:hypothetical protein PR048_033629 [Dryococelus australis]
MNTIDCKSFYTIKDILLGPYQLGSRLIDDRPIMNAVKYRVVSGVVWTNRTMVSSNTDTNRTGVLAVVGIGYNNVTRCGCPALGEVTHLIFPSTWNDALVAGRVASGNPWRDLLASQTSSRLLEFSIRIATTQECSGETGASALRDSSQSKTLYILPHPSGRQSLTEAVWPSVRERSEVWMTTGDCGTTASEVPLFRIAHTSLICTRQLPHDAQVAGWLARSPPTMSKPGSIPDRVIPEFSHVGIVPDDAAARRVFLGCLPFISALSFQRCAILTSITHVGSQDLGVQSRPNLFTYTMCIRRLKVPTMISSTLFSVDTRHVHDCCYRCGVMDSSSVYRDRGLWFAPTHQQVSSILVLRVLLLFVGGYRELHVLKGCLTFISPHRSHQGKNANVTEIPKPPATCLESSVCLHGRGNINIQGRAMEQNTDHYRLFTHGYFPLNSDVLKSRRGLSEASMEQRRIARAGDKREIPRNPADQQYRPARYSHMGKSGSAPARGFNPVRLWWEVSGLTARPQRPLANADLDPKSTWLSDVMSVLQPESTWLSDVMSVLQLESTWLSDVMSVLQLESTWLSDVMSVLQPESTWLSDVMSVLQLESTWLSDVMSDLQPESTWLSDVMSVLQLESTWLSDVMSVLQLESTWLSDVICGKGRQAAVDERLPCSPPTNANGVQPPVGSSHGFSHLGIVPGVAAGRRVFPGISRLPPPPRHSGAAPYSRRSPSSALKTSLLRASPNLFTHSLIISATTHFSQPGDRRSVTSWVGNTLKGMQISSRKRVSTESHIEASYRQEDCTPVQCFARRGDERVDAHVSVAPSAPALSGLRRAKLLQPGGHLKYCASRRAPLQVKHHLRGPPT